MILTLAERIHLLDILPEKGNILTLKALRVLKEALVFTEKEEEDFGIKAVVNQETNIVNYAWSENAEVEIEISPKMMSLIATTFENLEKNEQLTENHISLFEKFCE